MSSVVQLHRSWLRPTQRWLLGPQLILALLPAVTLLLAAPSAAWAQDEVPDGLGIRLIEVPADRVEDPRARSYVIDHVAPGTVVERQFEVSNGSDEHVPVSLYAAGAEIDADAFRPDPGRGQNELAGWMTVDPATVQMQPRGRITATLRIEVPLDATAGERYAVVLAEQAAPTDVAEGRIGVARRVGLRVYLSVGSGAEPATDFQITTLTALTDEDGGRVVRATVRNTGGRALDVTGQLTLRDGPGGLSAGPYDLSTAATLAPGDQTDLDVAIDGQVPAGPWLAAVRLASGTVVREADAELRFPDAPGEVAPVAARPADAEDRAVVPLVVAGLLAVLAGGGVVAATTGAGGLRTRWRGAPGVRPSLPASGAAGGPDVPDHSRAALTTATGGPGVRPEVPTSPSPPPSVPQPPPRTAIREAVTIPAPPGPTALAGPTAPAGAPAEPHSAPPG